MLYLDKPIGPIKGLMIYGDHADPSLFYYVPERPRLARNDGQPEFTYLKYRRDITDNPDFDPDTKASLGGGFLAFTVDLGVDDDQLGEVKKELAKFADGDVKVTPIQFRKGSVRLSITKDTADAPAAQPNQPRGFSFFEEVYGATTPSLFGFNRATFAVVLSMEAATLFEAALKSGISPIGVIYELEFLGLRPAFDVRISANYHRVYSELDLQFGAKGQIYAVTLGVDIGVAFQRLRDQGVIKVEVLNFTDDQNLRKQADAAFDWFKTELMKDFFKSSLEPPQILKQNAGGGGMLSQLTSIMGALGTNEQGSSQPLRGAPTTQAPTPAPRPTDLSNNVSGTSDANRQASGTAAGGGGAPSQSGSPMPFQVAFSLKYIDQVEDKERIFEYSEQAAEARTTAPQGMFSTVIQGLDLTKSIQEVSLDDDFFKRLVATVSMGGDLNATGVSTMAINLEYPGLRKPNEDPMHVDGFLFKPDQLDPHTFTTWLNDKKDRQYRYYADIHFKPDSPFSGKDAHVTTEWIVTRDRQLTLDPLDTVALLDIEASLGQIDATQVTQVQADLHFESSITGFDANKTLIFQPGAGGSQHWRLRIDKQDAPVFRYRLLYFLAGGIRYQHDWQNSDNPSLVINSPFQNSIQISLFPLLDPNAVLEADVAITYTEADTGYSRTEQRGFAGGAPMAKQDVVIPTLAAHPAGFTYQVTVIRSDGSVFDSGPVQEALTSNRLTLPIMDGVGKLARIRVKLASADLGSANLSAVKVFLTGDGQNPDTAEVLFVPSQTADQIITLIEPPDSPGPVSYKYKITGYDRRGVPIAGDTGQDSSQTLIVRLPS